VGGQAASSIDDGCFALWSVGSLSLTGDRRRRVGAGSRDGLVASRGQPQDGRAADAPHRDLRSAAAPSAKRVPAQKTVTDLVEPGLTPVHRGRPNRLWVTGMINLSGERGHGHRRALVRHGAMRAPVMGGLSYEWRCGSGACRKR
jgi:hypothetical protein